jgi:sphinganine-1-phosphate aldolase
VLSSRSEALLAAAWAVVHFLGEEGYRMLARKIIRAKSRILKGIREIGYRALGEPSVIAAFTSEEVNLFRLSDEIAKRGWIIQPQKGIQDMKIPPSLHLTITPIHDQTADAMLEDLRACTETVKKMPQSEAEGLIETFGLILNILAPGEMDIAARAKLFSEMEKSMDIYGPKLMQVLGLEKGFPKEMGTIFQLLASLPPEVAEMLSSYIVVEMFHKGT